MALRSNTLVWLGLVAVALVGPAVARVPDVEEIVPESAPAPANELVHVLLHHKPRSAASHRKLTDWIQTTHDRKVHPVHMIQATANAQKLTAVEPLEGADLVEYYGKVHVGPSKDTKKNTFTVVCDTGSGIFWVPGKKCDDTACKGHQQIQDMEGIQVSDGSVDIKYGTGSMTGTRAKGAVTVSGVTVKDQDMLLSTEENGEVFDNGRFDGVLGFGRPALAQVLVQDGASGDHPMPYYMNAMDQSLLQQPQFSFYIPAKQGEVGAMTLGGVNRDLDKGGEINFHDVKSDSYWMYDVSAIQVGSKRIDTSDKANGGSAGMRAIADSGTSLLVIPPEYMAQIKDHVTAKEDCSNMKDLKPFSLIAVNTKGKEVKYTMNPEDYVMKRGEKNCKTGIAVMTLQLPTSHKVAIAGDTFLRRYVSVYSPKDNTVGFVEADHAKAKGKMQSLMQAQGL